MNHILILSGKSVYCFGDKTRGALGNKFLWDDYVPWNDWKWLTCL